MGIGRFRDRNAAHDCCAEPVFVMAGNPNVGKSSLFNALTGLHQHTGNWTGKTVGCAVGYLRGPRRERHTRIALADLPGCYSLSPRTGEERAALHFCCPAVCMARWWSAMRRTLSGICRLLFSWRLSFRRAVS